MKMNRERGKEQKSIEGHNEHFTGSSNVALYGKISH